jgi:hypothetical protein
MSLTASAHAREGDLGGLVLDDGVSYGIIDAERTASTDAAFLLPSAGGVWP